MGSSNSAYKSDLINNVEAIEGEIIIDSTNIDFCSKTYDFGPEKKLTNIVHKTGFFKNETKMYYDVKNISLEKQWIKVKNEGIIHNRILEIKNTLCEMISNYEYDNYCVDIENIIKHNSVSIKITDKLKHHYKNLDKSKNYKLKIRYYLYNRNYTNNDFPKFFIKFILKEIEEV